MKQLLLEKLDWQDLLAALASHCQTEEAKNKVLNLKVGLGKQEILKSWEWTTSLCQLIHLGYCPQVGELVPIEPLLKSISLGRVLEGQELRLIYLVLSTTERLTKFIEDLADKAKAFSEIKENIVPCSELFLAIDKSIEEDGNLKDNASKALLKIRKDTKSLSHRIESKLKEFLHGHDKGTQYLQDHYFTKRLGRYVLPIRIDGRGRVAGAIIDTSVSAQTLFIEPSKIKVLNDQLIELSQLEKIEKMKILQQLSSYVKENVEKLRQNYESLVIIDYFTACALFAVKIGAQEAKLVSSPCISLIKAHHPLLYLKEPKVSRANDITLEGDQRTLIVSGPNAGGKSVILKTLGLIQVMASAGLLVPCDSQSEIYLFDTIYVELGDAQSLADSLSSFSGHVNNLKPIINQAKEKDLVLLDELATGTEPQTGAAIAQAVIESLHSKKAFVVVTTHFDQLKQIAVKDRTYRNGSMDYSLEQANPTYQLILDLPGQSFGIELAQKVGLGESLIQRAKEIRGVAHSSFDTLLIELAKKRDQLREKESSLLQKTSEVEKVTQTLNQELVTLKKKKNESIKNLVNYYDKKLEKMYADFYTLESQFKTLLEVAKEKSPKEAKDELKKLGKIKEQTEHQISLLNKSVLAIGLKKVESEPLPGKPYDIDKVKLGDQVYIIDLKKEGTIVDVIDQNHMKVEVAIGPLRVNVSTKSLRYLTSQALQKDPKQKKSQGSFRGRKNVQETSLDFQTKTNTLDVRGLDRDQTLATMWKFIDKALLRGERCAYIIHGHGMDTLKQAIRDALKNDSPYSLSFKPAQQNEGGDGVTIVSFKS